MHSDQTDNRDHPGQRELFRATALAPGASPPVPAPILAGVPDARTAVFSDGVKLMRALTGKTPGPARRLVAMLVRDARDDCAAVLAALQQAADVRPGEPIPWLRRAVQRRAAPPARSTTDQARHNWNLPSTADPRCFSNE